jgi:hypothetical protein
LETSPNRRSHWLKTESGMLKLPCFAKGEVRPHFVRRDGFRRTIGGSVLHELVPAKAVRPPRNRAVKRNVDDAPNADADVYDLSDGRAKFLNPGVISALFEIVPVEQVSSVGLFLDTLEDIAANYSTWRQQPLSSKSMATAQLCALSRIANAYANSTQTKDMEGDLAARVSGLNDIAFDRFCAAYYKQPQAGKDAFQALHDDGRDWATLAAALDEAAGATKGGDYPDNTLGFSVSRLVELLETMGGVTCTWSDKPDGDRRAPVSVAARFVVAFFQAIDPNLPPQSSSSTLKVLLRARSKGDRSIT